MEKRCVKRITLDGDNAEAELTYQNRVYPATILNYAFGGVLLRTDAKIPKNEIINIEFMADSASIENGIFKGVVIRHTRDGLALRFSRNIDESDSNHAGRVFG